MTAVLERTALNSETIDYEALQGLVRELKAFSVDSHRRALVATQRKSRDTLYREQGKTDAFALAAAWLAEIVGR